MNLVSKVSKPLGIGASNGNGGGFMGAIRQTVRQNPQIANNGMHGIAGVVRQAIQNNPNIQNNGMNGFFRDFVHRQFQPAPFVPSGSMSPMQQLALMQSPMQHTAWQRQPFHDVAPNDQATIYMRMLSGFNPRWMGGAYGRR